MLTFVPDCVRRAHDWMAPLLLLAAAIIAHAEEAPSSTVIINKPFVAVREQMTVLADPTGAMTIDQVAVDGAPFGKRPEGAEALAREHVYWIRFTLANPDATVKAIYIEPDRWHDARLYTPTASGFREQRSGLLLPISQRNVRAAYQGDSVFLLSAELPPAATVTFYLRVESDYRFFLPVSLRLGVLDAVEFRAAERPILLFQGIFLGIIFALCLYNLVLFLRIRDASYGYYVLFLAAIWFPWAWNYNLSLEWLWPEWPVWNLYAMPLSQVAIVVGLSQFTRRYLDTPRTLRRFDIALRVLLASQVLLLLVIPFARLQDVIQWTTLSVAATFLLTLATAIAAAIYSHPLAKVFLLATGFSAASHLLMFGRYFGLLPHWSLLANIGEVGVVVEGILLSLGLADRIRRLSDQVAEQRLAEVRMKRQQEEERRTLIEQQNAELENKVATRTADLTHERERTESLLRNILPASVADELKASGVTVPRRFEDTSILFTDFAGFTEAMGTMPGARMVAELNEIFAAFDDIIDRRGLEKIKTIGDAYLAAAGLPEPAPDHATRCVRAALDMVAFIQQRNEHSSIKWGLRVGIHSGPVVAGVVGKRKYAYDIWGDTVNIASRMESAGEPGRVNLSAYTYDLVRDQFDCEYRGKIGAKGKGEVDMYFAIAEKI